MSQLRKLPCLGNCVFNLKSKYPRFCIGSTYYPMGKLVLYDLPPGNITQTNQYTCSHIISFYYNGGMYNEQHDEIETQHYNCFWQFKSILVYLSKIQNNFDVLFTTWAAVFCRNDGMQTRAEGEIRDVTSRWDESIRILENKLMIFGELYKSAWFCIHIHKPFHAHYFFCVFFMNFNTVTSFTNKIINQLALILL